MTTLDALVARMDQLQTRLDAAESVLSIQALKARYAELVDRRLTKAAARDQDEISRLALQIAGTFAPDGTWDGGPVLGVATGRAEIAARMEGSTLTFSRHLFVNPRIEVEGDTAIGRWDVLSPCTTKDGEPSWMCGWEDDTYVRIAGTWLHQSMRLTTVFMAPAATGWRKVFV